MIVFSIAFGEEYVNNLFDRALPSLFGTPDNWFSGIVGQDCLRLNLFTTEASNKLMQSRAEKYLVDNPWLFLGGINVTVAELTPETPMYKMSSYLMAQAAMRCLDNDEGFCFVPPDLIWSSGAFRRAYALYLLTDKTVALFNGRINGDAPVPESGHASVEYFLANRDRLWEQNTAISPLQTPGANPGHLIYECPDQTLIFCSSPNPFMGKFGPGDQLILAQSLGLHAWDHEWRQQLEQQGRLIIQQDLNAGFSVEISPKPIADLTAPQADPQSLREMKFGSKTWCFSQTRTPAREQ